MFVLCPVLLITPGLFGAPAVYFSFSNQRGAGEIFVFSAWGGKGHLEHTRPDCIWVYALNLWATAWRPWKCHTSWILGGPGVLCSQGRELLIIKRSTCTWAFPVLQPNQESAQPHTGIPKWHLCPSPLAPRQLLSLHSPISVNELFSLEVLMSSLVQGPRYQSVSSHLIIHRHAPEMHMPPWACPHRRTWSLSFLPYNLSLDGVSPRGGKNV